jgi:hypothetical protein
MSNTYLQYTTHTQYYIHCMDVYVCTLQQLYCLLVRYLVEACTDEVHATKSPQRDSNPHFLTRSPVYRRHYHRHSPSVQQNFTP